MNVHTHTQVLGEPYNSQGFRLIRGDVLDALVGLERGNYQLIISSPPYNIGKSYERDDSRSLDEYVSWQTDVLTELSRLLAPGGSVCWQIGSFVRNNEYIPLDILFFPIFRRLGFILRNRIIWRFNFGLNSDKRFSGRYETLLWLTRAEPYKFNLDSVRVPQIYPGKRHSGRRGGALNGKPSGNRLGKNPSDYWEFNADRDFRVNPVWDMPNVKANHPEKTEHPCQFPVELAERCVLAFTDVGENVLDPFVGVGSSVIAAYKHQRFGTGIDRDGTYLKLAEARLKAFEDGTLRLRPSGMPVQRPNPNSRVAKIPPEWASQEHPDG